MVSLLPVLVAAMVAAPPPSAVYTTIPADLRAAAERFDRAQMEGDGELLEEALAPEFSLVSSSGAHESRAQFIADYLKPGFRIDPFVIREPVEKVWENGAVLGGLVDFAGVDDGQRFSVTMRFTDVWVKRNGRWRVINAQTTRVPTEP
jgi:hypothetical protein